MTFQFALCSTAILFLLTVYLQLTIYFLRICQFFFRANFISIFLTFFSGHKNPSSDPLAFSISFPSIILLPVKLCKIICLHSPLFPTDNLPFSLCFSGWCMQQVRHPVQLACSWKSLQFYLQALHYIITAIAIKRWRSNNFCFYKNKHALLSKANHIALWRVLEHRALAVSVP